MSVDTTISGFIGEPGKYAISDRFGELNNIIENKVGNEEFKKTIKEVKDEIESTSDKLAKDIKESKSSTIKEMNTCLETISQHFSAGIGGVSHNLEEHIKFFDECKKEQDKMNKDIMDTIEAIYKAFKIVSGILAINMAIVASILVYLSTL